MLECITCGTEFANYPGKPGLITQCRECGTNSEVPSLGGNMIWEHKTAPYIEVKPMAQARSFASKTRRFGAGVTCSLVESKLGPEGKESSKQKSGAEDHAQYNSRLGEKRTVKL